MSNENAKLSGDGGMLSNANIGPNIRRLRNLFDMKQEDLAKKLGVSRQMLHHYENNKFPLPEHHLIAVSEVFNVDSKLIKLSNIGAVIKRS